MVRRASRALLLSMLLLLSVGAFADSLTVGTTYSGGGLTAYSEAPTVALAQSFNMTNAGLINSFNVFIAPYAGATYTLWLTDSIGAGTTAADVIASETFTNSGPLSADTYDVTVNQTVGVGTYYIILSVSSGDVVWYFGSPAVGSVGSSDQWALGNGINPGFIPASNFTNYSSPFAFQVYDDVVTNVATQAPEPASMILLGSGALAAFLKRRKAA